MSHINDLKVAEMLQFEISEPLKLEFSNISQKDLPKTYYKHEKNGQVYWIYPKPKNELSFEIGRYIREYIGYGVVESINYYISVIQKIYNKELKCESFGGLIK